MCIYYTFCLEKDTLLDQYDDLSDLNTVQMESVREWEVQFMEKYDYVGRLLKPGDEPSEYTDEEDVKDHLKHDWPGLVSCQRLLLPPPPPPPPSGPPPTPKKMSTFSLLLMCS